MANKLSFDKKVTAVSMLSEGNSIRSVGITRLVERRPLFSAISQEYTEENCR